METHLQDARRVSWCPIFNMQTFIVGIDIHQLGYIYLPPIDRIDPKLAYIDFCSDHT